MPETLSYQPPPPRRSLLAMLTMASGICAPPTCAALLWFLANHFRLSESAAYVLLFAWFLSLIALPLATLVMTVLILRKQINQNGPSPDGIPLAIGVIASVLWSVIFIFLPFITYST